MTRPNTPADVLRAGDAILLAGVALIVALIFGLWWWLGD